MRASVCGGLLAVGREERRHVRSGRKWIGREECAEPDSAGTKCVCTLVWCELDLLLDGFVALLRGTRSRHVNSLVPVWRWLYNEVTNLLPPQGNNAVNEK